jgi:hypothetical protein
VTDFVWRTVEANPGVGLGSAGFREYWRRQVKQLLDHPLDTHLSGDTQRAYVELRAALVLILLHDSFGGFVMASDAPRYLATVMVPHSFQPIAGEELVRKANAFIRKTRKDTPFWEGFPLFRPEECLTFGSRRDPSTQSFCRALLRLPLGSRSHYFDVAALLSKRGGETHAVEPASSYSTRKRGLDRNESTALLLQSGLLARSQDLRAYLLGKSVGDLTALLSQHGVEFRKSWKKEKLVTAVLDGCPAEAKAAAHDVLLAGIAPNSAQQSEWAQAHIDRTTLFFQLWLGFGLETPT